jgi:glycerol-3-phosphate acyltransferase PlsY
MVSTGSLLASSVAALVFGYLCGSIPFGVILTRLAGTQDLRTIGSGNIGATNVLRTGRKALAAATLLGDMLKGTAAVLIVLALFDRNLALLAGFGAFLGHLCPVWMRFKGGKGVATCAGAFGYLLPLPMLASAVVFLVTVALTRQISLGSVLSTALFPLGAWIISHPSLTALLATIIAAGMVLFRHRENIQRIRAGTESRFQWKTPVEARQIYRRRS